MPSACFRCVVAKHCHLARYARKTPQRHIPILCRKISLLHHYRVRDKCLISNVILRLWADVKYHVPTGFGFSQKAVFLCFCFCAPSIYPLNHKNSSNKHFVRCGDKKIVLRFTSWHNSYLTFIWGLNISCLLYIVCYSRNAMGRMQRTFTFVFHIFPASHRGIFLITRTASLSRAS